MKSIKFFIGSILCYPIYLIVRDYGAPAPVRFAIIFMQVVLLLIGLFWGD